MSMFQVIAINHQWGVFAVNPNNPNDKRLTNVCETQEYANELASDLNRLAANEPTATSKVQQTKEEAHRNFLLEMPTGRKFR